MASSALDFKIAQTLEAVADAASIEHEPYFHSCLKLGRLIKEKAQGEGCDWIVVGAQQALCRDTFADVMSVAIHRELQALFEKDFENWAERAQLVYGDSMLMLEAAREFFPPEKAEAFENNLYASLVDIYTALQIELEDAVFDLEFIEQDQAQIFDDFGSDLLSTFGETALLNRLPYEAARERILLYCYDVNAASHIYLASRKFGEAAQYHLRNAELFLELARDLPNAKTSESLAQTANALDAAVKDSTPGPSLAERVFGVKNRANSTPRP